MLRQTVSWTSAVLVVGLMLVLILRWRGVGILETGDVPASGSLSTTLARSDEADGKVEVGREEQWIATVLDHNTGQCLANAEVTVAGVGEFRTDTGGRVRLPTETGRLRPSDGFAFIAVDFDLRASATIGVDGRARLLLNGHESDVQIVDAERWLRDSRDASICAVVTAAEHVVTIQSRPGRYMAISEKGEFEPAHSRWTGRVTRLTAREFEQAHPGLGNQMAGSSGGDILSLEAPSAFGRKAGSLEFELSAGSEIELNVVPEGARTATVRYLLGDGETCIRLARVLDIAGGNHLIKTERLVRSATGKEELFSDLPAGDYWLSSVRRSVGEVVVSSQRFELAAGSAWMCDEGGGMGPYEVALGDWADEYKLLDVVLLGERGPQGIMASATLAGVRIVRGLASPRGFLSVWNMGKEISQSADFDAARSPFVKDPGGT